MRQPGLKRYSFFSSVALSLVVATGAATAAFAGSHSFSMHTAAELQLTKRGEYDFSAHLLDILAQKGFDPGNGAYAKWSYVSSDPLRLDNLGPRFAPYSRTFAQLRDAVRDWLTGFELRDPKFSVSAQGIRYHSDFNILAVHSDPELTESFGEGNGVGLLVDVEIPNFRFSIAKLRGFDQDNPILGFFGLDNLWVSLSDAKKPLKLQVPVRAQVLPNGQLQLEALEVRTDIGAVSFHSGFNRHLVLPKIKVKVNDQVSTLDTTPIDQAFRQKEPQLLKMLQSYLQDYAENQLPGQLTDMMAAGAAKGVVMNDTMTPPGADPQDPGTSYEWGIRPENLMLNYRGLDLQLSGYLDDPEATWNPTKYSARSQHASMSMLDDGAFDFALSLNINLVNRALALSFDRGLFTNMDSGGGTPITLVEAPYFYVPNDREPGHLRLHIRVEHDTSGWKEELALKSPIQLDIEIDCRLEKTDSGTIRLMLDHIDENYIAIEDQYLRLNMLRGRVESSIRDKFHAMNENYAANPKVLSDHLPVPDKLFGVPVSIVDFETDPAGYLVFYMNLGGN